MSAPPKASETLPETLHLEVGATTDAAGREQNQDVAIATAIGAGALDSAGEVFLLVVADGMGGHLAGDVASRIAADVLQAAFPVMPEGDLGLALKQAYRKANDAVFQASQEDPGQMGMGTTLTSALLRGQYATVANVGDSRAYLLRGDGLTQVTRDHTVVAEEAARGFLSAEAARRDPRRNILTHVIGTNARLERDLPGIFELTLLPGDRLLLCSDGLYDVLDDGEIRRALQLAEPAAAARELVALAKQRGTSDNATAVVAAAIPTRIPVAAAQPRAVARAGGVPGFAIAAAVAALIVVLLLIAVFVLGITL